MIVFYAGYDSNECIVLGEPQPNGDIKVIDWDYDLGYAERIVVDWANKYGEICFQDLEDQESVVIEENEQIIKSNLFIKE